MVEIHNHEINGNIVTGRSLPSHPVSWVAPVARSVMIYEAEALIPVEGDRNEEDMHLMASMETF